MKKDSRQAFTMIELLVAMAVLAVLLVLMMNMVDSGTKLWRQTESRVDAYREARAALMVMTRDFQNANPSSANFFKFNILSGAASTNYGDNVFFLTSVSTNAQDANSKSDLCAVGYFLAYSRTPASTNQTLNLYRHFRSSNQTYSNLVADNLFSGITAGSSGEELLARNVVGLKITPISTNGVGQWSTGFSPTTDAPLPNVVEITVTAINQDLSKKLKEEEWSQTNSPLMKQAMQTFTTRVYLPNK